MAPTAISEAPKVDIAHLKSKVVNGHTEVEFRPPVTDDYMYDFKYNVQLPTIDRLGVDIPADYDVAAESEKFLTDFGAALEKGDAAAFANLFLEDGVWRDKVVFSWNYRTFNGASKIHEAAADLFPRTPISNVRFIEPAPKIERPYPDLAHIQANIAFDTDKVGATAVANIVLTKEGLKVWTIHTVIESLKGFPELPNRDGHMIGDLSWSKQREVDIEFNNAQPEVVVIGGGHNGLMMAARLKALGIPAIIIERNKRIGDNWRGRYEALSLHFPHWADHFPYMPYPEHWPVYTPAHKLGDFLEWYVSALELYAWTNTTVKSATQLPDNTWKLEVQKGDTTRTLTPKHIVMATSLAGVPMTPVIPGMEKFKGTVRHSTAHDSSRAWVGKKVLVVGTSSSGFDTAYDFARRNIDITLLQRSPTYIMSLTNSVPRIIGSYEPKDGKRPDLAICDRLAMSMPLGPGEELGRRLADTLYELDKPLIDSIEAKGFKTWRGQRGTGTQTLGFTKNGGFYFDAGACPEIANGRIKVEQGHIDHFTEDKVVLSGGREREFDLVILATGFSNTIDSVRRTLGEEIADKTNPIWGVDEEGEMKSAWNNTGIPNFWLSVGTLQLGRYHSKIIGLRIKADLEGIAGEQDRYTA